MISNQNASKNENDQNIPNVDEIEEILAHLQEKTINYKNYIPEDEVQKVKCKLLISSVNVRSLLKNGENVNRFINETKTDVLCMQEVWRNDFKKEGYDLHQINREGKRGGGVAILIRSNIKHALTKAKVAHNVEYIQVKVGKEHITSVYIPPMAAAIKAFEELEEELDLKRGTHHVMGDFNINLACEQPLNDKAPTEIMHTFCKNNALLPLIRNPTRITAKTATIIDNILTNTKDHVTTGVITSSIADHFATFLAIKDKRSVKKERSKGVSNEKIQIRSKKPENIKQFEKLLKEVDWREMDRKETPTQKTAYFQEQIDKAFEESFPLKTVKFNRNIHAVEEWVTRGILISRKTLHKLSQRWAKTRNPVDHEEYSKFKNILQAVTRKSKEMTYGEAYENNYNDAKKIWELTNKLLNRKQREKNSKLEIMENGKLMQDPKEVANILNEHFVNMGKKIADSFGKNENYMKHMGKRMTISFELTPITTSTTVGIIKKMKSKSSSGFDKISNKLIKAVKEVISQPLTDIINSSIVQGKVPEQWKLAKVIALHKGGEKVDKNNWIQRLFHSCCTSM